MNNVIEFQLPVLEERFEVSQARFDDILQRVEKRAGNTIDFEIEIVAPNGATFTLYTRSNGELQRRYESKFVNTLRRLLGR